MKFLIFKRNGEEIGEKLASYESSFKDDTTANRPDDRAEPKAIHIELPQGLDEDCVDPTWMELEAEHQVTLREPVEAQEEILDENDEVIQVAVEAQEGLYVTVPAQFGWGLVENSDKKLAKRQAKANANLNAIRTLRESLLKDADHSINELEDNGDTAVSLRQWRKALRECTDSLKKVNGDAKLSCENLVPSEFEFPAKPE